MAPSEAQLPWRGGEACSDGRRQALWPPTQGHGSRQRRCVPALAHPRDDSVLSSCATLPSLPSHLANACSIYAHSQCNASCQGHRSGGGGGLLA